LESYHKTIVKGDKISRKDAIVKAGKYAAFTAAAMMLVLDPAKKAQAVSPPGGPGKRPQRKHPGN
jgi:hypothetical protein